MTTHFEDPNGHDARMCGAGAGLLTSKVHECDCDTCLLLLQRRIESQLQGIWSARKAVGPSKFVVRRANPARGKPGRHSPPDWASPELADLKPAGVR